MSAALQPFFTKVDEVVADLEDNEVSDHAVKDAIDLLRRAAFVLGNMINAHNQLAVHLVLPTEGEKPAGEPAGEGDKPLTSVAEVAEVLGVDTDSDSHSTSENA